MVTRALVVAVVVLAFVLALRDLQAAEGTKVSAKPAENLFSNPGCEIVGVGGDLWRMDKGGKTEAKFAVDRADAAEGDYSMRVTIGQVGEWGTQFGQSLAAGQKGKTYTFAALAKAVKDPVTVNLEIERRAKPHDRAVRGQKVTIKKDEWTEIHVTFKVEKDFPEGWFAYISCSQPNTEYRADMFRLYEGEYIAYKEVARAEAATEGVRLFDTGAPSSAPLSGEAVAKRTGWKEVAEGQAQPFKGDACVANSCLSLVLRKGARRAECYYKLGEQMVKGPTLVPMSGDDKAKAIDSVKAIENSLSKTLLEVVATTDSGKKVATRYLLKKGKPLVEVQPGDGMDKLLVDAKSRYALLPDIFASDLVINPATTEAARLRFPSENLALQLTDGGNAIVGCAWRSAEQKVSLTLDGAGESRAITGTEIGCKRDFNVCVAVLAAPSIWHAKKIAELDQVKDVKPDWRVPFRALWRADYRREDGLIDSWKMPIRKAEDQFDGFGVSFQKPKSRTVWTSARGTFAYPVCIEGESALLRKTKYEGLPSLKYMDADSVVIYPYQKVSGSPANAWGAVDVLREALAGAPEAKLLEDMSVKRVARDKYPATCAVTEEYEKIFDAKEEKAKRDYLLQRLEAMDNFVIGIRSRIDEYLAWRKAMQAFFAAQKAAKPQVTGLADEFDGILAKFEKRYGDLKLAERTPAACKALIEKVKALMDSAEENKLDKAKLIGRDTRVIGGSQDHAIGDFRMITKELRQRAGYRMAEAKDDVCFDFAKEARKRTMEMLFQAFGHEGASTD